MLRGPFVALVAAGTAACSLVTSLDPLAGDGGTVDAASEAPADAALAGLYVDPNLGKDDNPGTPIAPLKTIKRALALAKKGDIVWLMAGTYDAAHGEDFSSSVPDGVEIHGTASTDAGAAAILAGADTQTALSFVGGGAIVDVSLKGFFTAFRATNGALSIQRVKLDAIGVGFDLGGDAHADAQGVAFTGGKTVALTSGTATLGLKASTVTGTTPDAAAAIFAATVSSALTLDQVQVAGSAATFIKLTDAAKLTATGSTFAGVKGSPVTTGLLVPSGATGTALVNGCNFDDLKIAINQGSGTFSLSLVGGRIRYTEVATASINAVWARGANDVIDGTEMTGTWTALTNASGKVTVKNASIHDNIVAVFTQASVVMRNTKVTNNSSTGIYVFAPGVVNLGASNDLGGNTFQNANGFAVDLSLAPASGSFGAVGNTWNANVQGADANGLYGAGVKGTAGTGRNYALANGQTLFLGP